MDTKIKNRIDQICKTIPKKEKEKLNELRGGSLWNKFMTKFGDKMPELHFISPLKMKKHNYTGPFTKLNKRLNKDEDGQYLPIPKPGNEPINRVDETSMHHDIAYSKSDKLEDRHSADKDMINKLRTIRKDKTAPMSERVDAFLVGLPMRAKYKLGLGDLNIGGGQMNLKNLTNKQLKELCKLLGMKNYSNLKKKQLITRIKKMLK